MIYIIYYLYQEFLMSWQWHFYHELIVLDHNMEILTIVVDVIDNVVIVKLD